MSDALPPLREVIARHDLGADKSFGQHFLLDLNITRKIARAAGAAAGDRVIEVGPGPGGLTRALLESGAHVVAVERDRRFIEALEELRGVYSDRLTVVEADALKAEESALAPTPVKIVSNLPYNISTELLVKWLVANHRDEAPLWMQMTLMFQKEVAERIVAAPGSKTYGRLSVIAQAASRPRRAFDLPARAFTPPPKVDSSVVTFEPAAVRLTDIGALERLTQAAFSQRRKMLRSSLKPLWGAETEARLAAAGIASTKRAEELSVVDFLRLLE
jgi:16S rRNA (adenine1518-N6/adenine1519-N6)-dimethyltransferase